MTDQCLRLHYQQPASRWEEALPIGNGRLGAMVFGRVHEELWQLNEDSVWYGRSTDRHPPDALRNLPRLRQLLDDGRLREAEDLMTKAFFATPPSQRHYEPLGQLTLTSPHRAGPPSRYERTLDLREAVTTMSYEIGGVSYVRETFSSAPQGVIVSQWTASEKAAVSFDLRVSRGEDFNVFMDSVEVRDPDILLMQAQTGGQGITLCLAVAVRAHGGESASLSLEGRFDRRKKRGRRTIED